MFYSRVQTILSRRRSGSKDSQKPTLEISAPFNFQREPVSLPGISHDELVMLREKAAASCIGVAEMMPPRSPSTLSLAKPGMARIPSTTSTSTVNY
ncbi:uncharacterized protein J7T54_002942 [Emericellopsis cladophorae]|uniref:Uncharacterized protein n=1 Tax=Emericellopsis cladophorae TaxID=2686198 RepID=A0A9Q0BBD8_9HYPO|nr:uncharacterized protein J7T54_002942 [Emericellopsis cladophorae]KAI6777949.1 hypothetical protein J7T54_002942 [Emericellopsis cladophorae]